MKIPTAGKTGIQLRRLSRQQGFSLVETIIAFVILGIILIALTLVPIMSTRLMSDTVEREKAFMLGVGKLDALETSFDLIADGIETHSPYTYVLSVISQDANQKFVELEVQWQGIRGPAKVILKRSFSSRE